MAYLNWDDFQKHWTWFSFKQLDNWLTHSYAPDFSFAALKCCDFMNAIATESENEET